jgi:hypothetical protein
MIFSERALRSCGLFELIDLPAIHTGSDAAAKGPVPGVPQQPDFNRVESGSCFI